MNANALRTQRHGVVFNSLFGGEQYVTYLGAVMPALIETGCGYFRLHDLSVTKTRREHYSRQLRPSRPDNS